jgi:hypothetical protein
VLFPASHLKVSLPTDQIVFAVDEGGHARVGFGGMQFTGVDGADLVFARVREVLPDAALSPDRSHTMRLHTQWVTTVSMEGRRVWPLDRGHS